MSKQPGNSSNRSAVILCGALQVWVEPVWVWATNKTLFSICILQYINSINSQSIIDV